MERLWATRRIGQIIDEIDLHGENQELVEELIVLSKRHGILTPYTAYLAEERTDLNDVQLGRRVTSEQLRRLGEEAGQSAFEQRSLKSSLRLAERAAPAGAPRSAPNASSDAFGFGGMSSGRPVSGLSRGDAKAMQQGGFGLPADVVDFEHERDESGLEPVKRIGAKTFFLRDGRYIDSEATAEQIAKAIEIEQFSDAYFDLLKRLDESDNLYLAEDRELVVVLNNKCYRIKLAKPKDE